MTKILFFKSNVRPYVKIINGKSVTVSGYENKIRKKQNMLKPSKLVNKAKVFSLKVHQNKKYGDKPYSHHINAVVSHLRPYGNNAEIAGYLHDTVEDTEITKEQLAKMFGSEIAGIVDLVTDKPGKTRKERKDATYKKMSQIPKGSTMETALIVKAADRLANMEASAKDNPSMLQVYINEHDQFKRAAYRHGLCDDLWSKINNIVKHA